MAAKLSELIARHGWTAVRRAALWLARVAWERLKKNLTPEERQEFLTLVRKMKHKPSNLTEQEKDRLSELVKMALKNPNDDTGN